MKPSKLPWRLRACEPLPCFIESDGTPDDGEMPYSLEVMGDDYNGFGGEEQRKIDAQFIVTACNAHDQLVAALKLAKDNLDYTLRCDQFRTVSSAINAALTAAGASCQ